MKGALRRPRARIAKEVEILDQLVARACCLLQLRNTVLEACGKSPDAAGFK
jgi:hypothetical protein